MAITKTWQVNTMERDISDGYVKKVIFRVKGMDGTEEKWRETGEVNFDKPESLPSDFVAYDSLTELTVINWVKAAIGSDQVTKIESDVENVTAFGKPF